MTAALWKRTALHVASDTGPRDGGVVVMVHGIASSAATFDEVVGMLPGYRVVTLELLGFGRSVAPATARYTIEEHAAALEAAIDRLGVHTPFVVVGHSLGALATSRYAAARPRGLSAVVLVSPPIYVPVATLPEGSARTAMGLYLRSYDYLRANRRFTVRLSRFVSRLLPVPGVLDVNDRNWTAFEASLKNAVESQTSVADIASIRMPVEIVYGTLDPFVVPEIITLLGALRHVHVRRVPLSTHVIGAALASAVVTAVVRHLPVPALDDGAKNGGRPR
jgi:pimeloyl-ACP methyl ester carboxylesterase